MVRVKNKKKKDNVAADILGIVNNSPDKYIMTEALLIYISQRDQKIFNYAYNLGRKDEKEDKNTN